MGRVNALVITGYGTNSHVETAYAARKDGWSLSVFIPGDTLTGYDPAEHTRIGLSYVLFDNEFGWLTQQLPDYFPVAEDPSLWAAVDLV